ncbi:Paired amphipathic helix repeat family protein [Coccidioides posadasii C735 delta SOWgp]|uniref:Paired amphipathic helix repeat family protein n=1 Tax=Coccidioides posadasii (strain C735) TaxID=222929 RepID=C5P411_COCP7|nr:Paired amphipathic helix repeat family protein [Coccidioides posadasii C735 delta SOWgp]EER28429.1 Paired amphipathic helix repeat family protein [Coccidioides posadasii C735 delta SOWgp]|eukprot:XP_003070574.1 Paired amphipathic helix repeat family protein [Coccidioides posadasii C735 delta SOWgp]
MGPYHAVSQPSSHTLPTLADLTQGANVPPPSHQQPPRYAQHQQPSLGGSHSLPGISQSIQHSSPQSSINRDRERESRDRDRDILERQREMQREEEMMQREREIRERDREHAERYHREQQQQQQQQQHHPVQSHTGSIPIHQPVASKVQNSIHGPNGLLSNLGATTGPNAPQNALQGSSVPGGLFGGQMQHPDGPPRQYMPVQSQSLLFGGNAPSQIPGSVAALAQGQQPILNDALSYLDQVKVRFVEHPDVYNRFLDIMKDFKSQAIDTPGVIQRVSTLFNGHPTLIQGFNTFLPPGYRIECGPDDNPDAIRVTTPSGTISMSAGRPALEATTESGQSGGLIPPSRTEYFEQSRPGWQPGHEQQQQQPQQGPMPGAVGSYSPSGRMVPPQYGQQGAQGQHHEGSYEYQSQHEQPTPATNAALLHQQEQRGVSQLQNAVSVATGGAGRSMMQLPPGGSQTPGPNQPATSLAGMGSGVLQGTQNEATRRGPVEFNHAISYVNKIKNRFADSPEIYKQFLEILQTYQRESKPIQDVYAQVTVLFNSAPDLLEDFKQFLPESAAQAKVQGQGRQDEVPISVSNVRGEPGYSSAALQSQSSRDTVKMPPLGQFSVKDSAKESKKRRGGPGAQAGATSIGAPGPMETSVGGPASKVQASQIGNVNKRTKLTHKPAPPEAAPAISPTLVPAPPEPIPPTFTLSASQEEYAFFDRVKKFIGNKQIFSEFLKLCNLYSSDLIDRNVLVNKTAGFIGSNQELMNWFKRFMHIEPKDDIIEPKAKDESGTVNLAHCRALGPSYRLLPKLERQKPCSGRDELCQSVLNDEWASHPTWASEDSGFVAHRKNQHEDSLHRVEEDRHDYDHYIEAGIRTIQLMEALLQQISIMTESDRANFKLPPGLGGQSETIYKKVIKKVYDKEYGLRIIDELFANPSQVLPIVIARLKQKVEEWKLSQREWEKVWREQMQKGYWRSLDHQSSINKKDDKKTLTTKHFQAEVQAKFEEARALRRSGFPVLSYQFKHTFADSEVILDTTYLILCYIDHNSAGFGADPQKVMNFVRDFVPIFFGMDRDAVRTYLSEVYDSSPASEEMDHDSIPSDEMNGTRVRRAVNSKKLDLLREVLDNRVDKVSRLDGERSTASISRFSTPGLGSATESTPAPDSNCTFDSAELQWMDHPSQGNFNQQREYPLNEPYKKKVHHLYGNLTIYCFIRTFEMLYTRLLHLKGGEEAAHEELRRAMAPKAAYDLGMIDKAPKEFFYDTDPKANLYHQMVRMCEELVKGHLDPGHMEDTLRRFYNRNRGWELYTLDKLLGAIAKFASNIFNTDPKDKSADIVNLFFKERDKEETTHNHEIQYRKQVERLIKDGDIYRISYFPASNAVTVQLLTTEDSTLESDDLTPEARWSYYVSAYSMRDPTEGVIFSDMRIPFLKRNLPPKLDSDEEYNQFYKPLISHEGLVIRVCANSYHILYEPGTEEWWCRLTQSNDAEQEASQKLAAVKEKRRNRFEEKFVNNSRWTDGLSKVEVDEFNQRFRSWIKAQDQDAPNVEKSQTRTSDDHREKEDEVMTDAD